jgi:hypothetical protein
VTSIEARDGYSGVISKRQAELGRDQRHAHCVLPCAAAQRERSTGQECKHMLCYSSSKEEYAENSHDLKARDRKVNYK